MLPSLNQSIMDQFHVIRSYIMLILHWESEQLFQWYVPSLALRLSGFGEGGQLSEYVPA